MQPSRKYYTICFPGKYGQSVVETWSEDQIIDSYYEYWCQEMKRKIDNPYLSRELCIEDWCVLHWADKTDKFGRELEID